MKPDLTLVHLVSEQTMQNLLPLLALRPARVIQIATGDARFAITAAHLEQAAREAGIDADFQTKTLPETSPDSEVVRHAIKQLLSVFPSAIVNITGGTKLMSIGAYLGSSEFATVPILYCDTPQRQVFHVGGSTLPDGLPTLAEISASLTLRVVMAAHGKTPSDWRFDTATPQELAFGEIAWSLRTTSRDAFRDFGSQIRNFYRSDKGRIPSGAAKLSALAKADLTSAFRDEPGEPARAFLEAAARAGFLAASPGGGFRTADGPEDKVQLRRHIEKIANLLDGSWLELAVLAFISSSPAHKDPHWSVEPAKRAAAEYGETDIVAVNATACALEIISCKTALQQPLEHLEGLRTRANNLGGNHARATLAVLDAGDAANLERLRRWGRLLRVNVLVASEIPAYFAP